MKYIVCARTTDDKIENPPNPPIVQPTVIVELSQPLDSLREAELWIEKQDRDQITITSKAVSDFGRSRQT